MDCRLDVPESVLFDILSFLPVVSLLRFKTVCKSWCSVIESSSFISQQLNHNSGKNNLIVQNLRDQAFILSSTKHESSVILNLKGIGSDFRIISSCNGIILGYEYSCGCWYFSLWNPATKQVRKLPESSSFSPRKTTITHGFAFIFDVKEDDYKIVAVIVDSLRKTLKGSLVQVYSMRNDSWRTIHEGCDFPIEWINYFDAACKNDMCLWIGDSSIENAVIFYFDLTKETYGTIPLPDDHKDGQTCTLAFVKEKLTYMEWNNNGTKYCRYYEIWRMDEFGIKESWNKLYKFKDPIMPSTVPDMLYLSKDEDFFLVIKRGESVRELYVYYFATAEVKKLDILSAYKIKNYIESMVSVKSSVETS